MALRKPLVLNAGQIEQIQAGDTLDATVTERDAVNLTNDNAGAITIGQPVYSSSAGGCDLAKADAASTKKVIGLVEAASIASSASGSIITDGILSSANWTSVIGAATLTSGAVYYLSEATAGEMTATAPATGFVVEIGVALSTTDFSLDVKRPIKL